MPAAMKAAVTSRVLRASSAGPPQTSTPLGDRVHVDDAIDAVMGLLHLHEIDDRAEVIAECRLPVGWTPENTFSTKAIVSFLFSRCRLP
jgi:hypothetical protein